MTKAKAPFFSIVIPSYNRGHLIEKTLNTIFKQSFSDFEIIVVDNCSTDNTVNTLKKYSNLENFRLIVNDRNYERAYSRNVGLKNANGKFVTLIDSDDLMYPNCLSDAYNFSIQNPGFNIFHNHYVMVDKNGQEIYKYSFPNSKNFRRKICQGNFLSCIGVFISKEVYSKYAFDLHQGLIGSEDWDFWFRILGEHDLGIIPQINSAIVHHDERSINSFAVDEIVARKQYVMNKIKTDPQLNKSYLKYWDEMEASIYLFASSMANKSGMYTFARKYAIKAFKLKPSIIFGYRFLRIMQISLFKIKNKHNI